MSAELLEQLRNLTTAERLELIEAASRLIREDLRAQSAAPADEDPVLQVAGCLSGPPLRADEIEHELYGDSGT